MKIQKHKLNIGKARRRVQMRSALVLTLGACLGICMLRSLHLAAALPGWLDALAALVCFGGGA